MMFDTTEVTCIEDAIKAGWTRYVVLKCRPLAGLTPEECRAEGAKMGQLRDRLYPGAFFDIDRSHLSTGLAALLLPPTAGDKRKAKRLQQVQRKLSDTPILYSAKQLKTGGAPERDLGVSSIPTRKASETLGVKADCGVHEQTTKAWSYSDGDRSGCGPHHHWRDQEYFEGAFTLHCGDQEPACHDEWLVDDWGNDKSAWQKIASALAVEKGAPGWMALKVVSAEAMRQRYIRERYR